MKELLSTPLMCLHSRTISWIHWQHASRPAVSYNYAYRTNGLKEKEKKEEKIVITAIIIQPEAWKLRCKSIAP